MKFFVDMKHPRECPVCHTRTMGKLVDDELRDKTFFGLPMAIARDQAIGDIVETRIWLDIVAYSCQNCARVELALLQPAASLQEAGLA